MDANMMIFQPMQSMKALKTPNILKWLWRIWRWGVTGPRSWRQRWCRYKRSVHWRRGESTCQWQSDERNGEEMQSINYWQFGQKGKCQSYTWRLYVWSGVPRRPDGRTCCNRAKYVRIVQYRRQSMPASCRDCWPSEGWISDWTNGLAYATQIQSTGPRKSTKGCKLCIDWRDGSTLRKCLADLKESNHI